MKLKAFFGKNKKWIILAAVVVLLAAGGCGVWYYLGHNSAEPVYVFPFNYLGMTEYWGDSQESYGPVTTDKIQTIYLSDTQTVTEILVQAGDTVKKGDLLMTFDTTLSDLALERKRLDVEKLKLQLEDAKDHLRQINSMKPMVIPDFSQDDTEEDANLGTALGGEYRISEQKEYDGSSKDKALVCWVSGNGSVGSSLFEALRQVSEEFQNYNAEKEAESVVPPAEGEEILPGEGEAVPGEGASGGEDTSGEGSGTEELPISEEKPYEPFVVNSFYVVFKVTEGDMSLGSRLVWQGMKVTRTDGGFVFALYNANNMADYTLTEDAGDSNVPEIDFGSGFTAAQIAQMRSEQEKKIKELEFNIKMAEAEYKIAQTEANDGNIYATIDGEVVSVLTQEEAKMMQQPILKVSGGGGFYVEGFVSELTKDDLQIGQEVTINDWNTGMTYTGTIESLGDFPSRDGYWNGLGNPVASYYPFVVFVDGSADLQEGRYVSVMYSAGTSENGIYLQNPFVRTENGKSYVFVLGEDGRLEQRFVTTGKSLWGSYTEILTGLSAEDLIAFPYGKNVKDGVPAVEGDMSDLYG